MVNKWGTWNGSLRPSAGFSSSGCHVGLGMTVHVVLMKHRLPPPGSRSSKYPKNIMFDWNQHYCPQRNCFPPHKELDSKPPRMLLPSIWPMAPAADCWHTQRESVSQCWFKISDNKWEKRMHAVIVDFLLSQAGEAAFEIRKRSWRRLKVTKISSYEGCIDQDEFVSSNLIRMKLYHQVCDNRTCLISVMIVVELPKSEGITAQRKTNFTMERVDASFRGQKFIPVITLSRWVTCRDYKTHLYI
jgi:hypothetical protein